MVIKTKQKKIFKYNENGRENIYQQQSESKHSMIKIQTFHERVKWCKREEQCNHTKMHAATIPLKQMVYTTLRERKRVREEESERSKRTKSKTGLWKTLLLVYNKNANTTICELRNLSKIQGQKHHINKNIKKRTQINRKREMGSLQ